MEESSNTRRPHFGNSALLALPTDVGGYIWDHIADKSTYASLSLTSKALSPISQRHLFSSLHLQPYSPYSKSRRTRKQQVRAFKSRLTGIAGNHRILSYVEKLWVFGEENEVGDSDSDFDGPPPDEFDFPPSLQEILACCLVRMSYLGYLGISGFLLASTLVDAVLTLTERQPLRLILNKIDLQSSRALIKYGKLTELEADNCLDLCDTTILEKLAAASRESMTSLSLCLNYADIIDPLLSFTYPRLTKLSLAHLICDLESLIPSITAFVELHPFINHLELPEDLSFVFSPDAVPDLKQVHACASTVLHLVPSRPVVSVTIYNGVAKGPILSLNALAKASGEGITTLDLRLEGYTGQWRDLIGQIIFHTPRLTCLTIGLGNSVVCSPNRTNFVSLRPLHSLQISSRDLQLSMNFQFSKS